MDEQNKPGLKKLLPVAGALAVAGAAILLNRSAYAAEPIPTVPHVDLKRYQGTWYEIARLPLHWENKCASHVTATYTLRPDGKISVLNQCRRADGTATATLGTAEPATGDSSNSRLKVSFFWPFKGDYWVLALDENYQWALVGTPNLKYLWILSRDPELGTHIIDQLLERSRELGFDTSKLTYTRQH
jgi:apolipoprotein D and lipocalin family protein